MLPIKYSLFRLFWQGVDFLYPPICGGCGKKGVRWCDDCKRNTPLIREPFCTLCGMPLKKEGICSACQKTKPDYSASRSWAVFDGPVRQALHRIKYKRDIGLADALAAEMLNMVNELAWDVDLVLPVPLGKERLKERGYNQAGLIARPLAWAKRWEYLPSALKREKETRSQVGLSANERAINVRDAFVAMQAKVDGKSVLVVDDVSTTGATLNACARALKIGGAREVYALSVAKALPHHSLKTV